MCKLSVRMLFGYCFIVIGDEDHLDGTDDDIYKTWRIIYNYLTNIKDNIEYQQRLCILHSANDKTVHDLYLHT